VPTFSPSDLQEFADQLLTQGGLAPDEAATVAESLVGANLRGYDSHGLMRIPYYLAQVEKGEIVPGAPLEVLKDAPAAVTVDGHWGFGQIQAHRLLGRVIDKAKHSGVAVGTMIRSAHIGRLDEYCETVARQEMIGMFMVNNHGAIRRVAPPGGKAPRLSTNPLAVGIPNGDEPIVLDFGTSATAEGKVRVMKIAGKQCPDGWLLDSEGRPTNNPEDLYADPPGTILPMGGEQTYKGFALSLMVEIFSGALSGGICAREVPPNQMGNCVYMMVMSPQHFGGAAHFAREVSDLVTFVRGCPRIDGVDEILLPGDPERRALAAKRAEGITLDQRNWDPLVRLAEKLGVAVPTGRAD